MDIVERIGQLFTMSTNGCKESASDGNGNLKVGVFRLISPYFAIVLLACHPAHSSATPSETAPSSTSAPPQLPPLDGKSLHFSKLQPFAPPSLAGFSGGKLLASTTQYGEVAVTEVERAYVRGDLRARIRLVDTSVNRSGPLSSQIALREVKKASNALRVSGAVGYAEHDRDASRATAHLVVGNRVLVTLTIEEVAGIEEVARLASALDLGKLEMLLR